MSIGIYSCTSPGEDLSRLEAGVSRELAQDRAARISDITYRLAFDLPAAKEAPIPGSLELAFTLTGDEQDLVLDFAGPAEHISSVQVGGQLAEYSVTQQHIVLPARYFREGSNELSIEFVAGDQSLNRSDDYLYTLFVPDRARTAFPCFDQPDLKASYQLTLSVPPGWVAVANGRQVQQEDKDDGRRVFLFAETAPIPTYLFAFAAGRFFTKTQTRKGREMTMYYRETDEGKVSANIDTVFALHTTALNWLETYTAIPYPFEKFDFVLLPGFQYGGMEHPGCIFYKEPSLLLDPSATENQYLGRARLIAHETAHMWFGDLVTMQWFNDVWLKEVFANFMAAKVVNPNFPDIHHELSFLMANQPAAYAEDRSEGSHPIQQPLENLKDAGSLYGNIIYQKAPVVMRQLEAIMGENAFQEGLRTYLRAYSMGNATWDDLIDILDEASPADLRAWSEVWVKQAGMPVLRYDLKLSDGRINSLSLVQEQQSASGNYWPQRSEVVLIYPDSLVRIPVDIAGLQTPITAATGYPEPLAILPNASAMAYGYFRPDRKSLDYFLVNTSGLQDPLIRGVIWLTLYEATLRGDLPPAGLLTAIRRALPREAEPLNRDNLLATLQTLYWRFLNPEQRQASAPGIEKEIWDLLGSSGNVGARTSFFRAVQSLSLSPEGVDRLYRIWTGEEKIKGLPLSENDQTALAEALALRLPDRADTILAQQLGQLTNPDRRQRLAFVRPALSPSQSVRDQFFEQLKQPENRHYEPWVVDAVAYLHHPLRAVESEKYILPSLELMEEIQATGDIFFPRQWITATLQGHQSPSAARIVRTFLAERSEYPYRLRNKILMAADLLFRASAQPAPQ